MPETPVWKIEVDVESLSATGKNLEVDFAAVHRAMMRKYGSDRAQRREADDGRPEVWLRFDTREDADAEQDSVSAELDQHQCEWYRIVAYHTADS